MRDAFARPIVWKLRGRDCAIMSAGLFDAEPHPGLPRFLAHGVILGKLWHLVIDSCPSLAHVAAFGTHS